MQKKKKKKKKKKKGCKDGSDGYSRIVAVPKATHCLRLRLGTMEKVLPGAKVISAFAEEYPSALSRNLQGPEYGFIKG